jgi:hypothetical protein
MLGCQADGRSYDLVAFSLQYRVLRLCKLIYLLVGDRMLMETVVNVTPSRTLCADDAATVRSTSKSTVSWIWVLELDMRGFSLCRRSSCSLVKVDRHSSIPGKGKG